MRNRDRPVRVASGALLVLVLVATSAGLLHPRAEACSLAAPGILNRVVWPAGNKAVPTNVHLLVSYVSPSGWAPDDLGADLVVLDDAGQTVPVTSTRSGTDFLLTPTGLLPAHSYRLADRRHLPCTLAASDCGPSSPLLDVATFTTTAGPDTTPPAFGGLSSASAGNVTSCHGGGCCVENETVPITLSWSAASDDVAGTDLRYNVYRQDGATLVPVASLQTDQYPFTGSQTCEGGALGRQLPPGAYVVRAVDHAGNEDQNHVTRTVHDECFSDCWICGCAVATPPPRKSGPFGTIAALVLTAIGVIGAARTRAARQR